MDQHYLASGQGVSAGFLPVKDQSQQLTVIYTTEVVGVLYYKQGASLSVRRTLNCIITPLPIASMGEALLNQCTDSEMRVEDANKPGITPCNASGRGRAFECAISAV